MIKTTDMSHEKIDMLLTKDPKRFIQILSASIYFDAKHGRQLFDYKYMNVFNKWLDLYANDIVTQKNTEIIMEYEQTLTSGMKHSYKVGKIDALSALPFTRVGLLKREVVDIPKVIEMLNELKISRTSK